MCGCNYRRSGGGAVNAASDLSDIRPGGGVRTAGTGTVQYMRGTVQYMRGTVQYMRGTVQYMRYSTIHERYSTIHERYSTIHERYSTIHESIVFLFRLKNNNKELLCSVLYRTSSSDRYQAWRRRQSLGLGLGLGLAGERLHTKGLIEKDNTSKVLILIFEKCAFRSEEIQ